VEGVGPTDPALQSFFKKLAVNKCGPSTSGGHLPHIPPKNKLNSVVAQTNMAVLKTRPPTSGGHLPHIPPKNKLNSVVAQTNMAVLKARPPTSGGHLPHIPPKNKLNSVVAQTNLAVLKAGPPMREKAMRLKSVVAKKNNCNYKALIETENSEGS
jgi:hypothetical protein